LRKVNNRNELWRSQPRFEDGCPRIIDYGRAISLFVHLHRATGDEHYLSLAENLATEAVTKLFHNGLFVGHPAKPYYENTNGVGLLLVALLELDAPAENLGGAL
jgi:rhamnogalacturonyl hydrolase YesR